MTMYFPDSTHQQLYIDMTFTYQMNFNESTVDFFDYKAFQTVEIQSDMFSMSMFDVYYNITGPKSYRIIVEPKGFIFLYNVTFSCTTIPYPGNYFYSVNFKQSINPNDYELSQ
jgi:hypothetical protein